jgi:predicted secreted hydrolase
MRRLVYPVVALAAGLTLAGSAAPDKPEPPTYAQVTPGAQLRFPADHGAHPEFRTEWWYVTGSVRTAQGEDLGFQVTFFRTRPQTDQRNPSAFAARQIIFAHAALSDPKLGRLRHGQEIARQGFGLAEAAVGDARVMVDDWRLERGADGVFRTHAAGEDFALDLALAPTQPILLQGRGGYSQKGPKPSQASYYYSLPHLKVSGSVVRGGRRTAVTGEAWLDREWSSTLLDPRAVGWDWVGLNLDDGGALTAFQVRDAAGRAIWTAGSLRRLDGRVTSLGPRELAFSTDQLWRSPRTGATYPVARTVTVTLPEGRRSYALKPLFPDQELDSRLGGGPVYWEGAVSAPGARGYLELTGYFKPLTL